MATTLPYKLTIQMKDILVLLASNLYTNMEQ